MIALPVALLLLAVPQSASRASLTEQLSFGDLNGDGLEDLYVPHAHGGVLFLREADGSLRPAETGTVPRVPGLAARWRDLEGHGDLDLFVYGSDSGHLLRNDGGILRDATVEAGFVHGGGIVHGLEWLDFDGDGRDDLLLSAERGPVVLRSVGEASFEPFGFDLLAPPVSEPVIGTVPGSNPTVEAPLVVRVPTRESVEPTPLGSAPGASRTQVPTAGAIASRAASGSRRKAVGPTGPTGSPSSTSPVIPVTTGATPIAGLPRLPGKGIPAGSLLLWDSPVAPNGFTLRTETLEPRRSPATWSQGTAVPATVQNDTPYGGLVNADLVVVQGRLGGETYAYNAGVQAWSQRATAPILRTGAACAAIGAQLFCVGGESRLTTVDALQIYDDIRDTWTAGAPLPLASYQAGAAAVGGKLYVIGGFNFELGLALDSIYCYDPALDTWSLKAARLRVPRTIGAAVAFEGKIYLFGEASNSVGGGNLMDVYDPATDTLTPFGASMPGSLAGGSAVLVNGEIHVLGMSTPAGHDIYDPYLNSWRPGFPLLAPEGKAIAGLLRDRIGVVSDLGNAYYEYGPFFNPLSLIEKD